MNGRKDGKMGASRRNAPRSRGCRRRLARAACLTLLLQVGFGLAAHVPRAEAQEAPATRIGRSLDHANRLLRAGRPEEAGRVLITLLEEHPTSASALALLFDVTDALGEPGAFLPHIAVAARRGGTSETALQELWVRGLLRSGRADEARSVAERWLGEQQAEPRAYAALAEVHVATGRPGRAIESLERGRRQAGDRTLFRDEMAELYGQVGRIDALVEEWLTRLAERPPDLAAVQREIAGLESAMPALEALWTAATGTSRVPEAQHSAALLALRLGRTEPARRLLTLALRALPPDRASVALAAYVREAEEAALVGEAAWGALRLTEIAASPRERWRWLELAGEKALEAGDTVGAVASTERLVAQAPPGSESAARALARLVTLLAARPSGVDAATQRLDAYIQAHPDSSMTIADLTLAVARGQVRADQRVAAGELLLEAPVGEGAARHIVNAALAALELQRGRPGKALDLLRSAATGEGVPQDLRTRWISLLAVLESADSLEVASLGRVLEAAAAAPAAPAGFDATALLEEWTRSSAASGRAAALGYLAGELEATGRTDAAVAAHEALVRKLPDSAETPAAMLALARHTLDTDPARSRAWLELLVTRFPDSAVAPLARRMLAELSGRAPAGN